MTRAFTVRRVVSVVAAVAMVVALALPVSAGASFDRHFSVISHDVNGHRTPSGFAFGIQLWNPTNTSNRVGHGHGRCKGGPNRTKAHCRVVIHLDGSIGGFGDLVLRGNFGHGDHTITVVDGDGDFGGGIAGKARVESISPRDDLVHFDLTR